MDEGLRGNFTPWICLSLADDLKGLGYRAVAISPGRGDVGVGFVTDTGLAVLWQRLEVLLGSGAHATAATVVRFRV